MRKSLKILMINKYYFIKGGSEKYYFELKKILELHGHQVIPFAMQHPENFDSEFQDYFVKNIEFNDKSILKLIIQWPLIAERVVYSFYSRFKIEKLINEYMPDIVHLHMIDHQISPSILPILKKYNLPVIQTAHQYKLVCPNYRFYNSYSQQICEKCLDGKYYHPIFERCHKKSYLAGLLLCIESYVHKILKSYEKNIDIFHVPSKFMGKKLVEGGIDSEKIKHLCLFNNQEIYDIPLNYQGDDYFIYFGRLSEEKGIFTLLKAMVGIQSSNLVIVGEGPLRKELESFVIGNGIKNIKFVGAKYGNELNSLIVNSKFVILPSEWYENSPLVVYESFALGKPVIGSDIGGISEFIDHEQNGLLFQSGNVSELRGAINYLLSHPRLINNFGREARIKAEREFSPQPHYERIYKLYESLLT